MAQTPQADYQGTSRKRKTYAIKCVFGFVYQSGYCDVNFAQGLIPPKTERKGPRVLTKQECEALPRAYGHGPREGSTWLGETSTLAEQAGSIPPPLSSPRVPLARHVALLSRFVAA